MGLGRRRVPLVVAVVLATVLAVPVLVSWWVGGAAVAAGPCAVDYKLNQWAGGFTADVTLTNLGPARTSWTLSWTFAGDEHVTSGWSAQVGQSGHAASAANLSYNGTVASGGTVAFGFQATSSAPTAVPADFALDGVPCDGAGPSPTPTGPTPTPTQTGPPPAGCGTAAFCDGFESQAGTVPSGRWSVSTPDCSGTGTVTVDTGQAHSGTRSVRVDGKAGYCNHVFVADEGDVAAIGPVWYGRFYVRHTTALPAGHVALMAMRDTADGGKNLRFGGQNQALQWNRESDDATLPEQSPAGVAQSMPLPVNQWTCVEFQVDGGQGQLRTWVDGTLVPGLVDDGVQTADVDRQWIASRTSWRPALADLRLGWESYAGGDDTLWFDDVAMGTSRIGC
jgi:hypothetical protein